MTRKISILIFLLGVLTFGKARAQERQTSVAFVQEVKIEMDQAVAVGRGFGKIRIIGWEGDTLEATASNAANSERVLLKFTESAKKITITLATRKTVTQGGKINLELKVPRALNLEAIQSASDSMIITDVQGFLTLQTDLGDIKAVNTKSIQARTGKGNITLENVSGRIDLITASGNISAQGTQGDIRIISVNARINIACAKGRVEISDTSSEIWLTGVEGDIDVSTSNGKAYYVGAIRPGGRYRLKTLSGEVSMTIPENTGFSVILSSYSGKIERDFALQPDFTSRQGKSNQRFMGRHGDEKAQIELDSFDGRVNFSKINAGIVNRCK